MAEEALRANLAPEVDVVCALVPWGHFPVTTSLRVPRHGHRKQLAERCAMHVTACVIAGTQHEVQLLLDHVLWPAAFIELLAAQDDPVLLLSDVVVAARCLMRQPVIACEIFHTRRLGNRKPGAAHGCTAVCLRHGGMTRSAITRGSAPRRDS